MAKKEITTLGQTSGQNSSISYLAGANGVTEKIKQAMYDAARQFVYIGFLLWEAQGNGYYLEGGYRDIYEYAEKELNFKRSSTKNFIAIATQFGNEYYGKFNEDNAFRPTMFLKPEYKDFNYSQLCELLSMSPAQREQAQPSMTVRELREIKKQPTSEPDLPPEMETIPLELPDDSTAGQTSGREEESRDCENCAAWKKDFSCAHCWYDENGGCPYIKKTSGQENAADTVSIVINNVWHNDVPKELVRQLVKLAGLRCTPSMCFNFTVKRHDG